MKIIPAIKALQKAVAANAAVPGSGIGVERTPRGTRIFLKEEPRGGASRLARHVRDGGSGRCWRTASRSTR
jgi:hypothetical protein